MFVKLSLIIPATFVTDKSVAVTSLSCTAYEQFPVSDDPSITPSVQVLVGVVFKVKITEPVVFTFSENLTAKAIEVPSFFVPLLGVAVIVEMVGASKSKTLPAAKVLSPMLAPVVGSAASLATTFTLMAESFNLAIKFKPRFVSLLGSQAKVLLATLVVPGVIAENPVVS